MQGAYTDALCESLPLGSEDENALLGDIRGKKDLEPPQYFIGKVFPIISYQQKNQEWNTFPSLTEAELSGFQPSVGVKWGAAPHCLTEKVLKTSKPSSVL